MFTPDGTRRPQSPGPNSQKTMCGSCALCKVDLGNSGEPKLLPCLHTTCGTCLTKIGANGETRGDCPLCAQSFHLSEVTQCVVFEEAPDYVMPLTCGGCEENTVSGMCLQCEEALCTDCMSAHRRVKVTRDHEVTLKIPSTGWILRRRCPLHPQESLRFFCLVCKDLTCKDCQLITHRGHSFMKQEEAVEKEKQQLKSMLDSIRYQKEKVIHSLQLLEARLQDIEEVKASAKKMLAHLVHSIYRTLLLKATEMLKEIQTAYDDEMRILLERKTSMSRLEGCQDYITVFIDKVLSSKGHSLLIHRKSIESQVQKLLSEETCTPDTMIKLQFQLQTQLCQYILNSGFLQFRKCSVPFTAKKIDSSQSKPVCQEDSQLNPGQLPTPSNPAWDDVIPFQPEQMTLAFQSLLSQTNQTSTRPEVPLSQASISNIRSADLQKSFSPSDYSYEDKSGQSNGTEGYSRDAAANTHLTPPSNINSEPNVPVSKLSAAEMERNAKLRMKSWTIHYYSQKESVRNKIEQQTQIIRENGRSSTATLPTPPNKTSVSLTSHQTHLPTHPTTTITEEHHTTVQTNPVTSLLEPLSYQTRSLPHLIQANNQSLSSNHPTKAIYQTRVPNNHQTQIPNPQTQIPNPHQKCLQAQLVPTNHQMFLSSHPILADLTRLPSHPIPTNQKTQITGHRIPDQYQKPLPAQSTPVNQQTFLSSHPILADLTRLPSHPIPTNQKTQITGHQIPDQYQKPLPAQSTPVNQQTFLSSHPILADLARSPLSPITTNQQISIPSADKHQNSVPTQPIPANNPAGLPPSPPAYQHSEIKPSFLLMQESASKMEALLPTQAPMLVHPITNSNQTASKQTLLSSPRDIKTLVLTQPMQRLLVARQTNIPITVISAVDAISLEKMTAISNGTSSKEFVKLLAVEPFAQASKNSTSAEVPNYSSHLQKPSQNDPTNGNQRKGRDPYNRLKIPVKALADSACDQESGVSSTTFNETDSEFSLPTSTISESDPKVLSPPLQKASKSTSKCQLNMWGAGVPTSFRQLVESTWLVPAESSPCSSTENPAQEMTLDDVSVSGDFRKKNENQTTVKLENSPFQINQMKRDLRVSLVRLPFCLPPHGDLLPDYYLTKDPSRHHLFVQESHEGQIKQEWRWDDIAASSSVSCSSETEGSPSDDIQFCTVCQSAGAALQCKICKNAFHLDCHIPVIKKEPWEGWVCLLCQDLNESFLDDDCREMTRFSLSLEDQRRCEKLLLGLLCEGNMGLLYTVTRSHSKTAEFEIILNRLQGKTKPPYRTAAELVSDLWTVLDILFVNAESKTLVVQLQKAFQKQLSMTFGDSLHTSLLKHPSLTDARVLSEKDPEKLKHNRTLKRMRAFFSTNCSTAGKKACPERGDTTTADEQ